MTGCFLRCPGHRVRTKHLCHDLGSHWGEAIAGTNSIGTALFEKKPVQITASEHYCKVMHDFTTSAAPIFSPEQELLGVLCIVGLYHNVHPHTLGMVVAAVKAIENHLISQKTSYELLIAYNKVTAAIETMNEGLIAIEANQRITQLNYCSAIPRDLVESELFGFEDGAFTGAARGGRPGKFELASGGTIFLDEIGDMPLDIQTSLLRVLQERQVTRIGGQKAIQINTRVIASTNKNLAEEVDKGNFRLDLYYRLNVITLPSTCPACASALKIYRI